VSELIEQPTQLPANNQPGLLETPLSQRIEVARTIATQLKDVIDKQNLAVEISGQRYVKVDGWAALGALCGYTPREKSIREEGDDVFAEVEIIDTQGRVVGGASSMVGGDEPTWARRPRYARRSMAVTRATGKAFRLSFSWVMALGGYAVTPFEEMPEPDEQASEPPAAAPRSNSSATINAYERAIEGSPNVESLRGYYRQIGGDERLSLAEKEVLQALVVAKQQGMQLDPEKQDIPF